MSRRIDKLRTAIADVVIPAARNDQDFNLRALLKASLARIKRKVPDAEWSEVIEIAERDWSAWLRESARERRQLEEDEDV